GRCRTVSGNSIWRCTCSGGDAVKKSMRARRMQRNHRRMKEPGKLTLVPIIDIFTMLLFFLMMNTGNVEVLDLDKTIQLPDSSSEQRATQMLLVKINADDIIVDGRRIASVSAVLAAGDDVIPALRDELGQWASRQQGMTALEQDRGRAVTIMGDHKMALRLLNRVMTPCDDAAFRDMSLADAALPERGAPVAAAPGASALSTAGG